MSKKSLPKIKLLSFRFTNNGISLLVAPHDHDAGREYLISLDEAEKLTEELDNAVGAAMIQLQKEKASVAVSEVEKIKAKLDCGWLDLANFLNVTPMGLRTQLDEGCLYGHIALRFFLLEEIINMAARYNVTIDYLKKPSQDLDGCIPLILAKNADGARRVVAFLRSKKEGQKS